MTILLNVVAWDKHASTHGTIAVSLCLLAGLLYEQAPLRLKAEGLDIPQEKLLVDINSGNNNKEDVMNTASEGDVRKRHGPTAV